MDEPTISATFTVKEWITLFGGCNAIKNFHFGVYPDDVKKRAEALSVRIHAMVERKIETLKKQAEKL